MVRFDPQPRWTRDHERFVAAWGAMASAYARRGMGETSMTGWIRRRYGQARVIDLTASQARQGRRALNAWRWSIEGHTAPNTATSRPDTSANPNINKGPCAPRDVLRTDCAR